MSIHEKFYNEWWWLLENHEWAIPNLYIEIAKVDPETRRIEDDQSRNTKIEFWLEGGPFVKDDDVGVIKSHDYELDCGGDTFEEAIIKYAALVRKHYGNRTNFYGEKK